MKTKCKNCGALSEIPKEYFGRTIRCSVCKEQFLAKKYDPPIQKPQNKTPQKKQVSSGPIKCPKCGCMQITANKKGFSGGKAVGGAILLGPLGILAGLHGSKKIMLTCLNCGETWSVEKNKFFS